MADMLNCPMLEPVGNIRVICRGHIPLKVIPEIIDVFLDMTQGPGLVM